MIKLSRSIDAQASEIFIPVYFSLTFSLLTIGQFIQLNFNIIMYINNNNNDNSKTQTDILFLANVHLNRISIFS